MNFLFSIAALLVVFTANAQALITCTAESNGRQYSVVSSLLEGAKLSAVSNCEKAAGSRAIECRNSLRCDGAAPVVVAPRPSRPEPIYIPPVNVDEEDQIEIEEPVYAPIYQPAAPVYDPSSELLRRELELERARVRELERQRAEDDRLARERDFERERRQREREIEMRYRQEERDRERRERERVQNRDRDEQARCYTQKYPDICQNSPDNYCKNPGLHFSRHGAGEGRTWGCN